MATYEQLHEQARTLLDPEVYDYVATGSGTEETLRANETAWQALRLWPRVLADVGTIDTSTSLLGAPIPAPVAVAPVGFQRLVHVDGEVAVARGTAEAGTMFALSTRSTASFEEVGSVLGGQSAWWFQVYLLRDRELTAALVRHAVRAGARALVLTADTPYVGTKARQTSALRLVSGGLVSDLVVREDEGIWQAPDLSYADIEWLHQLSGLPVVVKGVLRADDARASVDAGASAIWVSNHGGRQLDGVAPTAVALPEVVAAVGDDVEIYVDGGIRHGRDVLRALALGARAAFVGRPVSWALATGGADGVRRLLDTLRAEVEEALALAGCRRVADVTRDLLGSGC